VAELSDAAGDGGWRAARACVWGELRAAGGSLRAQGIGGRTGCWRAWPWVSGYCAVAMGWSGADLCSSKGGIGGCGRRRAVARGERGGSAWGAEWGGSGCWWLRCGRGTEGAGGFGRWALTPGRRWRPAAAVPAKAHRQCRSSGSAAVHCPAVPAEHDPDEQLDELAEIGSENLRFGQKLMELDGENWGGCRSTIRTRNPWIKTTQNATKSQI
jgi:hypothetical protein